jgi:hypothetical protein
MDTAIPEDDQLQEFSMAPVQRRTPIGRAVPAEALLVSSPLVMLLYLEMTRGVPTWFPATVAIALAWGLLRWIQRRTLPRATVVGALAPACTASLVAVVMGLGAFARWAAMPSGVPRMIFVISAMCCAFWLQLRLSTRWLSRRSVPEARFFLYYQAAFPVIGLVGDLLSYSGRELWLWGTVVLWSLASMAYLRDDRRLGRISHLMRGWVAAGLTFGLLRKLLFVSDWPVWSVFIALILVPLFLVDRGLPADDTMARLEADPLDSELVLPGSAADAFPA